MSRFGVFMQNPLRLDVLFFHAASLFCNISLLIFAYIKKLLYLCSMIQHFLDYIAIERKYSQRTVEAYHDDLRDFCRYMGLPVTGDWLRVSEEWVRGIGEDDVKGWMLWLIEEQKQSPRSVKRKLSALHSFFKFLLRIGKVKRDVTARVVAPKADKHLPVFFREEEMEAAERNTEYRIQTMTLWKNGVMH